MVWVRKDDYETVSLCDAWNNVSFIYWQSYRLDDAPGNEISNILVKVG